MPKWRRRAEARPEEILEAALETFLDKGFEASRMEDIAARAGLSKAGVYLYFNSKHALLNALIDAKIRPIAIEATELAKAGEADPKAAIGIVARALVTRMSDPNFVAVPRLVLGLSTQFPEIGVRYRERVIDMGRAAFEHLFTTGTRMGQFRDIDPGAAARAFVGPLIFEALWTHIFQGESAFKDTEKLIRNHLEILFNGIILEKEQRA